MRGQNVCMVSEALRYVEEHLDEKLDLGQVAEALHYSRFYLHRIFTKTAGMTLHDYIRRRQLTEAAKLLVFSEKSVSEIALIGGYESRQAFTGIFKAMYKMTPAEFRKAEIFYPLQLPIRLEEVAACAGLTKESVRFAGQKDEEDWMELVRLAIDGYPRLEETTYRERLRRSMAKQEALILRDEGRAAGILGFSAETGNIDFLAVHPQYRKLGITKLFLDKLSGELLPGREITLTTYREGDPADTGYREEYRRLGFAERELLTEYGYPTQRFALCPGTMDALSITGEEDPGHD